tara:strand:+ start:262 stop:420 length:159 start_codon:yes stop_codon:yes gene_type:complete
MTIYFKKIFWGVKSKVLIVSLDQKFQKKHKMQGLTPTKFGRMEDLKSDGSFV